MRCLYCGREIGAFKLRRDGEFCSKDHRKNYGDRLNKVLHQISSPEPPPAGVAAFVVSWPRQNGSSLPTLHRWDSGNHRLHLREMSLTMVVDVEETTEQIPPLCRCWMPGSPAEPVMSFVRASAAPEALGPLALRIPAFSLGAQVAVQVPAPRMQWLTSPPAEPAERFIIVSYAAAIPCAAQPPAFTLQPCSEVRVPPPSVAWMPGHPAEPAERMLVSTVSAVFASVPATVRLRALDLAAEDEVLLEPEEPLVVPAACEAWMPGLAAEPVAAMVWPATGEAFFTDISHLLRSSVPYTLPALPKLQGPAACTASMAVPKAEPVDILICQSAAGNIIASNPETVPELALAPVLASTAADATFAEPPLCESWMRAPEPEPVFSFVQSSTAAESFAGIALRPAVLTLAIAEPYVPSVEACKPVPAAESVMAGVWPHVADAPLTLVRATAELRLPDMAALSLFSEKPGAKTRPEVAEPAAGATPEPVESWVAAAVYTMPASAAHAAHRVPERAAPALVASNALPMMAGPVPGAPPVGVESMLVSVAATALKPLVAAVEMPAFAVSASLERAQPKFEQPGLAASPSIPKRANNVVVLRPISTISLAQPQHQSGGVHTNVPQPGFIPVEYHAQRMRGEPACALPWQAPNLKPVPPRFAVRPLFERLEEELAAQKPARKEPAFAEVFAMPEAKKHSANRLGFARKAIAAGLVIGGMWLGTSMVRLARQPVVARQTDFGAAASPVAGPSLSAAAGQVSTAPAQSEAKGPMAWVRKSIVNRATYQAGDNFKDGMQAWGAASQTYAPGWQKNRDGYVHMGELALFNPSLKLADYRFEFFGQVEKLGMGWVVRAKDPQNYYAVKVKVLEAGLRPIIAVVHYPVLGGKAGRQVETPLNVMVHNNEPFQVAVNVKGNRFSASIEGEEVDSWSDDRLPSGGVGFFADAGESARLYWMKVTTNDDWLGHVCTMLAGDSSARVTSEVWGAGFGDKQPGGIPRPEGPGSAGNVTLAAAGLGLPGLKARGSRNSKYGRNQTWNS